MQEGFFVIEVGARVASMALEPMGRGRHVGILVDAQHGLVPLVRTTLQCTRPASLFTPDMCALVEAVQSKVPGAAFNNAMVETYTDEYRTMKYHTDQALDLADDSYICLYSAYNNPRTQSLRYLETRNKKTGQVKRIDLTHGSCILFSTRTNQDHVHRIGLVSGCGDTWLGVTLRLSKTRVSYDLGVPHIHLPVRRALRLANDEEKAQWRKWKAQENKTVDFHYPPDVDFTLSPGDLLQAA